MPAQTVVVPTHFARTIRRWWSDHLQDDHFLTLTQGDER